MSNFKKYLKAFVVLVVIILLASFGMLLQGRNQSAQVISSVPMGVYTIFNVNETVRDAQSKLKDMNLYFGRVSGLFGFKTEEAIRLYQVQVGLPVTGILDIPTQERLFAPPQITYTEIPHTKYGDQFLFEWSSYFRENANNFFETQGVLVREDGKISLSGQNFNTEYSLLSENIKYTVYNLSEYSIEEYVNIPVQAFGAIFENQDDENNPTIVIYYLPEKISGELENYKILTPTTEGNKEARAWIEKALGESGNYFEVMGRLEYALEPVVINGEKTIYAITTLDGTSYAVYNISANQIEDFIGQSVVVRGFLLSGLNNQGYQTMVINYLP